MALTIESNWDNSSAKSRLVVTDQAGHWYDEDGNSAHTIIGKNGIERIVDIKLNADEQAMMTKSVDAVKGLVAACKGIDPSLA